jgi:hypothetical protein
MPRHCVEPKLGLPSAFAVTCVSHLSEAGNRLATLTYPDDPLTGMPDEEVLTYGYDDVSSNRAGRVKTIMSNLHGAYVTDVGYAVDGSLRAVAFGNGSVTEYGLDDRRRLDFIKTTRSGSTPQELAYD